MIQVWEGDGIDPTPVDFVIRHRETQASPYYRNDPQSPMCHRIWLAGEMSLYEARQIAEALRAAVGLNIHVMLPGVVVHHIQGKLLTVMYDDHEPDDIEIVVER